MEELFVPAVSALVVAVLAFFTIRLSIRKKKPETEAPANPVVPAAQGVVQETFDEAIERIERAKSGKTPEEDLATLGNARSRR
tara:strand:+ start:1040 stop:1288 length:249 start_codon:yes stop_codon:yes gene_type:complete